VTRIKSVHEAAMASAFDSKRKGGPDCAYCRRSEFRATAFVCKDGLPQDAAKCPSFNDSRKPSVAPPDFLK
jgi:hypothetical protein